MIGSDERATAVVAQALEPGPEAARHGVCVFLLLVVGVLYAGRYWLHWDGFVEPTHDEAIWIPLMMRWNDPSLFEQDPFVTAFLPFFPTAYVWLSAWLLRVSGDPGLFLLATSSALLLIYGCGVYWLGWLVVQHRLAALALAIASFRVNVDLSGTGWGIFVGHALPRSFVFAVAPWLVGAFLKVASSASGTFRLGVALGLAGNLHPLSILHLYLMMAGALLLGPATGSRLSRLGSLTLGLGLGMAPYVLQWAQHADASPLPLEIVAFRAGPQSFPSWEALRHAFLASYVPVLMLAALGWRVARSHADRPKALTMVHLGATALACAAVGPLLTLLAPRLFAVHLLRMSGYLFLFSLILTGFVLRRLLSGPSARAVAAGYAVAAALFLTAGGGRIGELTQWGTATPSSVRLAALGADVGPKGYGVSDQESFLALCAWVRANTPPDALFLAPPRDFASFRIYAHRALFITFKDGAVTLFSGRLAEEWYARYRAVERLYLQGDQDAVVTFSRRHGIGYVIRDTAQPAMALPVAYENQRYQVYEVRS